MKFPKLPFSGGRKEAPVVAQSLPNVARDPQAQRIESAISFYGSEKNIQTPEALDESLLKTFPSSTPEQRSAWAARIAEAQEKKASS